jgi:hypothetical protein
MRTVSVNVAGTEVVVAVREEWNIGAIATAARWQAGCGPVAFDHWEVRDAAGQLLSPAAPPGDLTALWVNPLPGIGG